MSTGKMSREGLVIIPDHSSWQENLLFATSKAETEAGCQEPVDSRSTCTRQTLLQPALMPKYPEQKPQTGRTRHPPVLISLLWGPLVSDATRMEEIKVGVRAKIGQVVRSNLKGGNVTNDLGADGTGGGKQCNRRGFLASPN